MFSVLHFPSLCTKVKIFLHGLWAWLLRMCPCSSSNNMSKALEQPFWCHVWSRMLEETSLKKPVQEIGHLLAATIKLFKCQPRKSYKYFQKPYSRRLKTSLLGWSIQQNSKWHSCYQANCQHCAKTFSLGLLLLWSDFAETLYQASGISPKTSHKSIGEDQKNLSCSLLRGGHCKAWPVWYSWVLFTHAFAASNMLW